MVKKADESPTIEKVQKKLSHEAKEQIHTAALALADLTVEENAHKAHLIPLTAKKAELETKLMKELGQFQKKLEDGALELMTSLAQLGSHDSSYLSTDVVSDLSRIVAFSYTLKDSSVAYFEQLGNGKSLQELCTVSDETMQKLYLAAKQIYDQKHYKEAVNAFAFLTFLNPTCHTFWLGLGNAQYQSHQYENALFAFANACQEDPSDPFCHLMSCRCYEAIKEIDNAINALDLALYCISERKELGHLKPTIEKEKNRLSQKKEKF